MAGYENLAAFWPGPDIISGATLVLKMMELPILPCAENLES